MSEKSERARWWKLVDKNIAEYGHHITLVTNEVSPSFAYTIGLASKHGCELAMGGSVYFGSDEIIEVVNEIAARLGGSAAKSVGRSFALGELGTFTLGAVRDEWRAQMLGALERTEDDYWEMFPCDPAEIDEADGRLVSLAVLVALDATLLASIDLPLGEGLLRESADEEWRAWRSRKSELN